MRDTLEERIGWGVWLLAAAVFVAFLIVVLPAEAERTIVATGTSETPDSSYLYAADDLERLAGEYGEQGREHYIRSRFTFDIVWPLVYGSFLQSSLLLASRRTVLGRLPGPVVFLPSFAVVFDLLENVSAAIVMASYPTPRPMMAQFAPVFTFLKWNLLYVAFALSAIGALAGLVDLSRRYGRPGAR